LNPPPTTPGASYLRGILLVLVTTTLWGLLPIFLKIALTEFSAATIAWFRFAFAFFVLFAFLACKGESPRAILLRPPKLGLLAGAALAANYLGVTLAVQFSGPSNVAILIQFAPVILVLVGVFIFRENLTRRQYLGLLIAAVGFGLFFVDQRANVAQLALYSSANSYVMFAGAVWVVYMVCQKILSRDFSPQSLNLLVYGVASILLAYPVTWAEFNGVDWTAWLFLIFLGFNTLFAYGALAEAVKIVPITLISILITLNPLITLLAMLVFPAYSSGRLAQDPTQTLGYIGAVVAVIGVVLVVARRENSA